MCREFLLYKNWRILPGIFLEFFFLGTVSHKNEERTSAAQKSYFVIRTLQPQSPGEREPFSRKYAYMHDTCNASCFRFVEVGTTSDQVASVTVACEATPRVLFSLEPLE